MKQLTLTRDDRKAIDGIGHRYFHGDELFSLLIDCVDWQTDESRKVCGPSCSGWDDPIDWQLEVPEHIVHAIRSGLEQENWEMACFAPALKRKFELLCLE